MSARAIATDLMTTRRRLDAELVRRGLARSRDDAADLVAAGRVSVAGATATKPATAVAPDEPVVVREDVGAGPTWVSRGAHKLLGALDAFPDVEIAGRLALDAGISTGGFTHVLLDRGVEHVVGVDVGYGQVAWPIRTDPRVTVLERTNVRDLVAEDLPYRPDLVVADLSFISLRLVLPVLRSVATDRAEHLLLVKPQFEVGRDRLGRGGVVRDAGLRAQAVRDVARAAYDLGLGTRGVVASPLPGPSGNVEYVVRLGVGAPAPEDDAIADAVARGPQ